MICRTMCASDCGMGSFSGYLGISPPWGFSDSLPPYPRLKRPGLLNLAPVGAVTLQDCSFARKGTTAGYQPDTSRRMGSHHFYHGRSRLAYTTRQVVRAACAQKQSLLVLRFVILSSQNLNAPQLLCLQDGVGIGGRWFSVQSHAARWRVCPGEASKSCVVARTRVFAEYFDSSPSARKILHATSLKFDWKVRRGGRGT